MQATLDLNSINAELAAAGEAARETYLPAAVARHPFERLGLGKAPFRCTGVDIGDTRCQFCTTPIKYVYHIAGADGSRFHVGSECVKQTGGEVADFAKFNRQMEARVRELRAQAKAAKIADAWKAEHAAEWAYIQQRAAAGSTFYAGLVQAVAQYGDLSAGRLACVQRDMAQAARPAAPAPQARPAAPAPAVVNLEPVQAAFDKAAAAGVQRPTLRLAGFVFNLAPKTGSNPGAIYVKERAPAGELPGKYLGKVLGGKFFASRECDAAAQAEIVAVSQDPKAAAVAYGRKFGKCSVCNCDLTDAASVEAGIGPICAAKYGF